MKKNWTRWKQLSPESFLCILHADPKVWQQCTSESGHPNLQKKDSPYHFLHSNHNPKQEALEWFASLYLINIDLLYVYGIGLGYLYEAAIPWLRENSSRQLIFIEKDPCILFHFLNESIASSLLFDPQVTVYFLNSQPQEFFKTMNTLTWHQIDSPYLLSFLPSEEYYFPSECIQFKSYFTYFATFNRTVHSEFSSGGLLILRNYCLNIFEIPQSSLADKMRHSFSQIPAIVCGAGPSLIKNAHLLSQLQNNALIIAGGTALNALNAQKISPHLGAGIDPNQDQFTRLIMNQEYELPFLFRNRMLPEALSMVHGDRLFMTGSCGYGIAPWIEEQLHIESCPMEEGFNVLNFSLAFAHMLGCNPILCIGIDLAYTDGLSYPPGILSHPIHHRKHHFSTKKTKDEIINKPDIYGQPTLTLWKWISEAMWYTAFQQKHPEVQIINATEGGIGFEGIPAIPLKEAAEQWLQQQHPIELHLHGEIQNHTLSHRIKKENILESLHTIADSLENISQKLIHSIQSLHHRLHQKKHLDALTRSYIRWKKKVGYKTLLHAFDENIDRAQAIEKKRLKNDRALLSKEAYISKKTQLWLQKLSTLHQIAHTDAELIREIIQKKSSYDPSKSVSTEKKTPPPFSKSTYKITDSLLVLSDPFIPIDYHETLSAPLEKQTEYYSNHSIKIEIYRSKQLLHGPSRFYSQNGTLLAECWYLNGKAEGKHHFYYENGALHSVRYFRNGLKEHSFYYYYPDGSLKSTLPYLNHQLHGTVTLYHENGDVFRTIEFFHGQRKGKDSIWDKEGKQRIEAHFLYDQPVETARVWHINQTLAQEITYDEKGNRITFQEWDDQGNLIEESKKEEDYFDSIAKHTQQLNTSIKTIYEQLEEISLTQPGNIQNSLNEEVQHLNEHCSKMKTVSDQIYAQICNDTEIEKEPLWRNRDAQKQLEKHLQFVAGDMKKELDQVHSLIADLLKKLESQ